MNATEIISALEKIRREDPKRFYSALGFGDDGVNILHPFIAGSYELGLVAGALWAFEQIGMSTDRNQERRFLPGEQVIYEGKRAEVIDTYASGALMIRIGRNTFKSVLPGEVQLCGPDGGDLHGSEVRFG